MNLFELNEKYRELEQRDDLDPETLKDTLDSISDSRETKLDNIATWIENNEGDIDKLNKKIKGFQSEKKRLINKNQQLNKYMTSALEDWGIKKISTDRHIIKLGRETQQTVIFDEKKIPNEFYKASAPTISKSLIKEAIQNGINVPGAELKLNRKTVIK